MGWREIIISSAIFFFFLSFFFFFFLLISGEGYFLVIHLKESIVIRVVEWMKERATNKVLEVQVFSTFQDQNQLWDIYCPGAAFQGCLSLLYTEKPR